MSRSTTASASAKTRSHSSASPASHSGGPRLSVWSGLSSRSPAPSGSSALTTAGSSMDVKMGQRVTRRVASSNATSWPWNRTLSPAKTACES